MTDKLNIEQRMRRGEARQINAEAERKRNMRYGDDQCERCGGVRVAKSFLCAACLVKQCHRVNEQRMDMSLMINALKKDVKICHGQLDDALAYGFKQNQENAELKQHIKEIQKEIERGMEDGKDG